MIIPGSNHFIKGSKMLKDIQAGFFSGPCHKTISLRSDFYKGPSNIALFYKERTYKTF